MKFLSPVLALLLAVPAGAHAQSAQKQSTGSVAAAVRKAALGAAPPDAVITVGPVEGAAFMPLCAGALTVNFSGMAPYEQAAAHCPSPAWTLYVTVTIAQTAAVVVLARPVAAGQVFGPGDFTVAKEQVGAYAGRQIFYDATQLLGASATMSLAAGTIITANDLTQPVLVKAGQLVTVDVLSGGAEISIVAQADETGRLGDTILLTNPSSGRRFSALVTASGVVVRLQS